MSLLVCGHVLPEGSSHDVEIIKDTVQNWFKDHSIKSFYTVQQSQVFSEGAINIIGLTGLGKLSPNMVPKTFIS